MAFVQQKTSIHAPHHHHNHRHEEAKYLSSSVPTSITSGLNGYHPRHERQNSNSNNASGISPSPTSSPSPTISPHQPPPTNSNVPYYKIAVQNSTNQQAHSTPPQLSQSQPYLYQQPNSQANSQQPLGIAGSPQNFPTLSRKFVARRISEGETGRLKEELKCQACGKGYKHVSSLAKHLWEHTPEWNVTSKLLISKHQQVQLLEAASILVSMNEEDEEEEQDNMPAYEFGGSSYVGKASGNFFTNSNNTLTPPLSSGINKIGGNSYFTASNVLTPPPTSGSNSASGTPTLPEESNSNRAPSTFSDSSPSPPPNSSTSTATTAPSIPISSSTRAISKHSSSLSSSLHFARRSSLTVSSAYPPSATRRGSIPNVAFTPSSPGIATSLTRASAASLSKSPIVTDSLFSSDSIHSHKTHDEYEMLATPYRTRRMSHMRGSRGDIFNDNPSPPDVDDEDKSNNHSNGDESNQGVFGDMDD